MNDLKISKEQVERFQAWKEQYLDDIGSLKAILESEIGEAERSESKTYKMLCSMEFELSQMDVKENVAMSYGKEITSSMKFGYEVCRYINRIYDCLSCNSSIKNLLQFTDKIANNTRKLREIFNLV